MYEMNETKTFKAKENLQLTVNCKNIGMYIKGSDFDEAVLKVSLESDRELSFEDIFIIDFNEDDNFLEIKVNETGDYNIKRASVTLKVPKTSMLDLKSNNGGFKVKDIKNEVKAMSQNGKLSLKQINSPLSCQTRNGKISLKQCQCKQANIESMNGSIKLLDTKGEITLDNKNGKIKCTKCKGDLQAKTVNSKIRILNSFFDNASIEGNNGSIYYEFNNLQEGNFNFKNKNGKIHLVLPADTPYNIQAKNKLGKFYIGLPGDYELKEEDNRKLLYMTRKSGLVKISAENERGSISLINKSKIDKNINFGGLGDEVNTIINSINSEEIQKKVKKKMEKAREKLKKLSIKDPKIMENVEHATSNLTNEIKEAINNEELQKAGKDIAAKVKGAVKQFVKDTKHFTKSGNSTASKSKNGKTQSRLKILEMLEKGKINAAEAEKLLNALEK